MDTRKVKIRYLRQPLRIFRLKLTELVIVAVVRKERKGKTRCLLRGRDLAVRKGNEGFKNNERDG